MNLLLHIFLSVYLFVQSLSVTVHKFFSDFLQKCNTGAKEKTCQHNSFVFKNSQYSSLKADFCEFFSVTISLVSLLSVFSKIFEKNDKCLFDHLNKIGIFSDFQYDFRSSHSTVDLLTVTSARIAWMFYSWEAT